MLLLRRSWGPMLARLARLMGDLLRGTPPTDAWTSFRKPVLEALELGSVRDGTGVIFRDVGVDDHGRVVPRDSGRREILSRGWKRSVRRFRHEVYGGVK